MTKLSDLHQGWMKDPAYADAYQELQDEFSVASALISARSRAHLTQEDVAKRMHTTQSVIARLESGRANASTKTLERYAKAIGARLVIDFIPQNSPEQSA